jgi:TonB family protein
MAARNKPYDSFGPYILFKKLETDSLGELWRAGRLDGGQLGATVALRRFAGGDRDALNAAVTAASGALPKLGGASFVRDQVAGVEGMTPFLAWDYAGGRSLRYVIDRGRGGKDTQPNPLPIDQAMVIAEKIALSLATMNDLRDSAGTRLSHGALLPQFIWISDDGEIRVAGQLLGTGISASLADPKVAAEVGRYFPPEQRGSSQKGSDVYSMGAILFLLITGHEPPDAATASAFMAAVRAARTPLGEPIPDDLRVVLDKSFNLDPSMRYPSMTEMKQAISTLAHGGRYSATTFNLAFYLSNLLKKEMEAENADRDKEAKVNLAPYLEVPKAAPMPVAAPVLADPTPSASSSSAPFSAPPPARRSPLPLAVGAVVVLALAGGGAYMMLSKKPAAPDPAPAVQATAVPVAPRVISEPIAVSATTTAPATSTTGSADPAAAQKAFEEAVRQKMNEEMMKLQDQYMAELRRKQAATAPAPAPVAAPVPVASNVQSEELSAARLDQQRREASRQQNETAVPATQPASVPVQPAPAVATPQPAVAQPAPVRAAVREGDVIDVSSLDALPRPTRPLNLQYPQLARNQKVSATVIVSALVDENGRVTDVKVLRGEPRYGINDAATRAMRSAQFSAPMKDGKRVKTWLPQTFDFKP